MTPLLLPTRDGCTLEGELAEPEAAGATAAVVVLCHPHPQFGGSMRSIVTSALFDELPGRGFACVRFNFRGVGASTGSYSDGRDEPLDVLAAIDAAARPGVPLVLAGWSFGADVALAVDDGRVGGWVAIAPPLRFGPEVARSADRDARPKLLVLAAHDEFRDPGEVAATAGTWRNTRIEVVAGASHFFVGRTDRVVDLTAGFAGALPKRSDG